MSQFYGTVEGSARTLATRRGSKNSGGLIATAASWHGCVRVHVYEDEDGDDAYRVYEDLWHGSGQKRILAEGKFPTD